MKANRALVIITATALDAEDISNISAKLASLHVEICKLAFPQPRYKLF